VTDKLNSYFIDNVEELVEKTRSKDSNRSSQILMDCNLTSMYFFPISEDEIVALVYKLKDKASSGFDETPDFLVKECTKSIKNNVIFNESGYISIFIENCKN
jgi:hypothetical protein